MSWIASPSHLLLTARSWQLQLPTQLQIVAWTFAIVTKIVILILYCVVENVHQMENYICIICVAYHHLYCGLRLQFSGQFCLSASRNRIAVIIKRKVMLRAQWLASHSRHHHPQIESDYLKYLKPWLSLLVDNGGTSSNKAVARNWCFSVWGRCKGSN